LVQGVGFRPFIYRLAVNFKLSGWVENRNDGVLIMVEGKEESIAGFLRHIRDEAPVASIIESVSQVPVVPEGMNNFKVRKSKNISDNVTLISPDISVCNDCLGDMKTQPHRVDYPFINCTNCGPRFSIIRDLPYDRDKTTMDRFKMCHVCSSEYNDLNNRRFHAQPVACNNCGPVYRLLINGTVFSGINEILGILCGQLDSGGVVAMKGTGGFHLVCDAFNQGAVKKLRQIKHRDKKPFAVMFSDIEEIRKIADVDDCEELSLLSWRKPIVILKLKKFREVVKDINSVLDSIGIMLPYMPVHYMLFEKLKTKALVMTSGNFSDEPIIFENDVAVKKLSPLTDAVLIYDRDIFNRCDDSVVHIVNKSERVIRRSRGFVPAPVRLAISADGIFAAGADMKNCFCIGKEHHAILSQHIGDLEQAENYEFYKNNAGRFEYLFRSKPLLFAGDMHPGYYSNRYVNKFSDEKIFIQHHHAHIASCMAENNIDEQVIGISFDGTGYGDDGAIWGSEFLICDFLDYHRIAHFEYIPLPGGDNASREPWRMAVSYLFKTYGSKFLDMKLPLFQHVSKEKIMLVVTAIEKGINCPLTSSAGRLFDAVSSLTGICHYSFYEAEAAMLLESAVDEHCKDFYSFKCSESISLINTVEEIVKDIMNKVPVSIISARFHNTVSEIICEMVKNIRSEYHLNKVALSGGVFQNRYLSEKVENMLLENGFELFIHRTVPANDGGIALGQLAIAAKRREKGCA
jgi:hydrogenase maturation protein HypF